MKGHVYKRSKESWTLVYDLPTDFAFYKEPKVTYLSMIRASTTT